MTTNHTPTPETTEIVFPHFWMHRNEGGWRWVSRDGTKSSVAAFEMPMQCALAAEHELTKTAFVAASEEADAYNVVCLTARVAELEAALRGVLPFVNGVTGPPSLVAALARARASLSRDEDYVQMRAQQTQLEDVARAVVSFCEDDSKSARRQEAIYQAARAALKGAA